MKNLVAAVFVLAACAPVDMLVGSYNFTLTGTDTETAPGSGSTSASGTGVLAITHGIALDSYDVSLAQNDITPCELIGGGDGKDLTTFTVDAGQACTFPSAGGTTTATLTSGNVKLNDDTLTLNLAYSFVDKTVLGNVSGTGTRTYTGPRF